MIKQTHYCDGCGKKLEGERLKEAQEHTFSYNATTGEAPKSEIFCFERCSAFSRNYWEQSADVAFRALTDANSAINNHRRKFFASRLSNLKEVM